MEIPEIPADAKKRQVDHLFLLVGGNPLPLAVAGLTLVQPDGRLTLVYTEGTRDTKDRLIDWFDTKFDDSDLSLSALEVDEADASTIHKRVGKAIEEHLEPHVRVGLNYTGGTKAMAVHAYRAVEDKAANPVFSYLDARTLRMLFDPGDPTTLGGGNYAYVGHQPELSFERLLNLHDWQFRKNEEPSEDPLMLDTAEALRDMNAISRDDKRNAALQEWMQWKDQWRSVWLNHQLAPWDRRQGKKEHPDLLNCNVSLPSHSALNDIADALRADLGSAVNDDDEFQVGEAAEAADFYRTRARKTVAATDFCRWLDGTWLESLVLDALQSRQDQLGFHRTGMGFCLEERSGGGRRTFFEFDVVALRGHQLFGFSCSSSSKGSELKLKLFELCTRVRQFGGSEACAALVTPYHDPKDLQREMRRDLGTDRLKVFGREHLEQLEAHLAPWVESQTGRSP